MKQLRGIRHFNLVIVPRFGHSFLNVVISQKLIFLLIAVFIAIAASNMFLVVNYYRVKSNLVRTKHKVEISAQVVDLKREAAQLREEIESLKEASDRIEEKTGITVDPGYEGHIGYAGKEVAMPSRSYDPEVEAVRTQLRQLRLEVDTRKKTVEKTEDVVDDLVTKIARIPSIRPVKPGRITSGFGYRRHPISGRREFHRGIDMRGDHTTPIYATADGKVTYTGWKYGYGRVIEVDHRNGFETLYAHNYRNLVKKGEMVQKGQIIAYVGSSGTTTGSHLHYEVHFEGRILNPRKFLSLTYKDMEQF